MTVGALLRRRVMRAAYEGTRAQAQRRDAVDASVTRDGSLLSALAATSCLLIAGHTLSVSAAADACSGVTASACRGGAL